MRAAVLRGALRRRAVPGPSADVDLLAAVQSAPRRQHQALLDRLRLLLSTLGGSATGARADQLVAAAVRALDGAGTREVWLALSVLTAELPDVEEVVATHRRLVLDGPAAALGPAVAARTGWLTPGSWPPAAVSVLDGEVLVDMHHTSETDLATGIQRVAREAARRWDRDHDVVLVGWTPEYRALRRLDPQAARRALGQQAAGEEPAARAGTTPEEPAQVVVPWRSTYTIIELATEQPRTSRMHALARFSGNRTGAAGMDCVPLTMAETSAEAMGGAFARLLAAVRHMHHVAAISDAAAAEYRGWREMLVGTGCTGPEVSTVSLVLDAERVPDEALAEARARFCVGSLPLVLVVGSHEPRKNHLAVLHAAELLWRDGVEFVLQFVGGNAWHSEQFVATLDGLRAGGRLVSSVSGLSDELLWAGYRLARTALFPSLGEGYGLPVAEALACGTPVITSRYGSTAEIAQHGGALLVDPRDDHDIAAALRRLLQDDELHGELAAQAAAAPRRTWDDYASELWTRLVGR